MDSKQKYQSVTSSEVNESKVHELHQLTSTFTSCNVSKDDDDLRLVSNNSESGIETSTTTSTVNHTAAISLLEGTTTDVVDTGDTRKDNANTKTEPMRSVSETDDSAPATGVTKSSSSSSSDSVASVRPPLPAGASTVLTRNGDKTTTVTVTAGGITATVTTTDSDDNDVGASVSTSSGTAKFNHHSSSVTSVSTAPAVSLRHSSVTCPDLSKGIFPLTGVPARSEKLLQMRTTTLDNYQQDEEETRIHALTPLQVVYEGGTGLIFNRPTPANVVRKCVYMYEDKYSFCR